MHLSVKCVSILVREEGPAGKIHLDVLDTGIGKTWPMLVQNTKRTELMKGLWRSTITTNIGPWHHPRGASPARGQMG